MIPSMQNDPRHFLDIDKKIEHAVEEPVVLPSLTCSSHRAQHTKQIILLLENAHRGLSISA